MQVESVVQTTETLDGVSMQRKVVERCKQFRKEPLEVRHESLECGEDGCRAQLRVRFTKDAERRECSIYASEDLDDPAECERLIQAFRNAHGRDARSFEHRTALLDRALVACSGIDVRPTPLLEALTEQLWVGMGNFEQESRRQFRSTTSRARSGSRRYPRCTRGFGSRGR